MNQTPLLWITHFVVLIVISWGDPTHAQHEYDPAKFGDRVVHMQITATNDELAEISSLLGVDPDDPGVLELDATIFSQNGDRYRFEFQFWSQAELKSNRLCVLHPFYGSGEIVNHQYVLHKRNGFSQAYVWLADAESGCHVDSADDARHRGPAMPNDIEVGTAIRILESSNIIYDAILQHLDLEPETAVDDFDFSLIVHAEDHDAVASYCAEVAYFRGGVTYRACLQDDSGALRVTSVTKVETRW